MAGARRNTITPDEERLVGAVSAISGVVAAFSDASPTATSAVDIVLVAALAAFVTWAGASAAWWALSLGSGLAVFGALGGPIVLVVIAVSALAAGATLGSTFANKPILRAGIAAATVQVMLRLEWDGRFLGSALIAALAMGLIVVSGTQRRKRHLRKRVLIGLVGVAVFAALAGGLMGIAALQARSDARDGYVGMLDGLEFLQNGQVVDAAFALDRAAGHLDDAADALDGPISQPARLMPAVAQNRNGAVDVLRRAADAAESAADTLEVVDLDLLTVSGGVVDVDAFAALSGPLEELEATVVELRDALRDAESPWLVRPMQTRLTEGLARADQAAHQAEATAAAASIAPAMLGADEPRTYFLAFVNAAEARGQGGLMGNWTEITIDNGSLSVTADGRTADLQTAALNDVPLDISDEYLARYSPYGARLTTGGVAQKYWSNVTMSADMPSVGSAMAQMYETATGRSVDGVFVIDAEGLASLLSVTGSIELPEIDRRLDGGNAEQFLLLDQYEFAESEREDLLTVVTEQTIANVLESELPPPQRMAPTLAPSVLNGHISGWALRPEEQVLFDLVGMDASLPEITTDGTDAIAVVSNNASGNKIETFLERTIQYSPVVHEASGRAEALMRITLSNRAPATGFPEYVIGNIIDLPTGTNRTLIDVYTRLGVDRVRLDGADIEPFSYPELGYNVFTAEFDIPAGESAVLELWLSGELGPGEYRLVYRPQPLPSVDRLVVEAELSGGSRIFGVNDMLERRSVISRDGVEAWRESTR